MGIGNCGEYVYYATAVATFPPWINRVPFLRVYPALQEARERLRQSRTSAAQFKERLRDADGERRRLRAELVMLKAQRENAALLAEQRGLALESLGAPALHTLAEAIVDEERLTSVIKERQDEYRRADPFPHIVIDDVFPPEILEGVLKEFEAMDRTGWRHSAASHERKSSMEDPRHFGPLTSLLVTQLNSGPFVTLLEKLTGIDGLLPDPHLRGGGLHEIRSGGFLGVHADFNLHPRLKVYRRLNLIVYLNKEWDDAWGGSLELWDRTGQRSVRSVTPAFNRTVLFDTSNFSYHGHPRPLVCPADRSRKSLALYYYSVDYPFDDDRAAHSTIFVDRDLPPRG